MLQTTTLAQKLFPNASSNIKAKFIFSNLKFHDHNMKVLKEFNVSIQRFFGIHTSDKFLEHYAVM